MLSAATQPKAHVPADKIAAGLKAAIAIASKWGLNEVQTRGLLGGPSHATFYKWKRGEAGQAGVDLVTRVSLILGIHKALRVLFESDEDAYGWPGAINRDFGGQSALDVILAGGIPEMAEVRNYLDAVRGGW